MKCRCGFFFVRKKVKKMRKASVHLALFVVFFWAGDFAGFLHRFASCFSWCPCHKKDKSGQEQQAVAQMQGLSGRGLTMATTISCCQCLFQFQGCRRGCTLLQELPSRHTYAPSGPLPPSPACNMSKKQRDARGEGFPSSRTNPP